MPRKPARPDALRQPSLLLDPNDPRPAGISGALDGTPADAVSARRQRILKLREHHRVLSELTVSVNRELAHIAAGSQSMETPEAVALLAQLRSLQEQRTAIEAATQDELAALKTLERRLDNVPRGPDPKRGLLKVRHPNQDFFLADLFDYAMKDDGASMEAPIFTLSTKPDLSIWEWRSK
ncbi:MAG: hypothetical protein SV108_05920, partial [Pseudomonadota bacterium]|nr:hypothetical protein [Pseudomonadota bacterium]